MIRQLPVLFLKEIVVFPKEIEQVRISHKRAHNIVSALEGDTSGITHYEGFRGQMFVVPEGEKEVGCVCNFDLSKTEDGDIVVHLLGVSRGRFLNGSEAFLASTMSSSAIPLVDVLIPDEKQYDYSKCKQSLVRLLNGNWRTFGWTMRDVRRILRGIEEDKIDLTLAVDRLSALLSGKEKEFFDFKKSLLAEFDLYSRINLFNQILFSEIEKIVEADIARRVKKNIDRQQHEFILREKMKVIREELGDSFPKEAEIAKLKEKLEQGKYPDHVRTKALEEIRRLEMCSSYSNESIAIKSYLDWLLVLP